MTDLELTQKPVHVRSYSWRTVCKKFPHKLLKLLLLLFFWFISQRLKLSYIKPGQVYKTAQTPAM